MIEHRRDIASAQDSAGGSVAERASLLQWAKACLEQSPAPVTIVEREGHRIVYANPAFRQAFSALPDAHGRAVADLFDARATSEIESLVERGVTSGGQAQDGFISTRSGSGSLPCSVWPLVDREGDALAIVMIESYPRADETRDALRVDVAQRLLLSALRDHVAAEAALAAAAAAEAANASKAKFLATMSHELRTPLHAIGGYIELIAMGLRGPVTAAQREDLSRIAAAQNHILGLINAVLSFSKLGSGSVSFEMGAVDLSSILDSVLAMVMARMESQHLVYRDVPPSEALMVDADPEKLRQILLNLLTNAIKFTEAGGTICTTYDVRAGVIAINIADTGRGIPSDQLPTVFDPFVQVGRRLPATDQGVGLGLSISRELARAMGGEITATSTVGVGSTFTLTLRSAS